MTEVWVSLLVLLFFTSVWIILAYVFRGNAPKRGMGLPRGSIRAIIAIWVIGAFIVFVFFGRDALSEVSGATANGTPDPANDTTDDLYEKVLVAFTTLVAAVSGFYFGGRTGQTLTPENGDPPSPGERGTGDGKAGKKGKRTSE